MNIYTIWRCKSCGLSGEIPHSPLLPALALIQKIRDQHYATSINNGLTCRWNANSVTMRRQRVIDNPPEPETEQETQS